MRLLIVEDEQQLAQNLKKGLEEEGYAVDLAFDGEQGSFLVDTEPFDLFILDISLPKMDGISLCKHIRKRGLNTPVLMLTAKSEVENKVEAFDSGADDYLTKPFSLVELFARIKALLRRKDQISLPEIRIDDLVINTSKHEVYRSGKLIQLTPKEFSLLEFLAKNKDYVVTRTMLTEHVWDTNFEGTSNVIDVLMGTLRKKIDQDGNRRLIHTVYGVGFKLSENA